MEKKIFALVITAMMLGSLVVLQARAKPPPTIIPVTIGDIVINEGGLPSAQAIAQIALEDINSYFVNEKKPYRLQVEFKIAYDVPTHLTKVQEFNSEGVNLLLAGRWSSMAHRSLDYCNEYNILMLSPTSTVSPNPQIVGDNLFRLFPSDADLSVSLAHTVWSKGVERIVFIWRVDNFGGCYNDYFTSEYVALGGSLTSIGYPGYATDFSEYLTAAEEQVASDCEMYGASKVGVVLIGYNEAATILNQAADYPNLYACTWFGTYDWSQDIIPAAGEAAAHVKFYSPQPKETHGPSWKSVESRYTELTGNPLSFGVANEYDIFWLYALSIVKAGSVDPLDVKAVLPSVAAKYNGASGYCTLNEYGDRLNRGFNIWGYNSIDGQVRYILYGSVDLKNKVKWLP